MFKSLIDSVTNLVGKDKLIEWIIKEPVWDNQCYDLLQSGSILTPSADLDIVLGNSDKFPRKFPTHSVRCKTLKTGVSEDTLNRNIQSAYPLIHENVLELCAKFILLKREHGSNIEKNFYKDITIKDLIEKFLKKRAVTFVGDADKYILLDGKIGVYGWESVGRPEEKEPLLLKDCLSYDEMKLSAFLSVSSYTHFVTLGHKQGVGSTEPIEEEGIIIGLIGARFAKENFMEYQEIVVTPEQNTEDNGYGSSNISNVHHLFSNFYEENCLLYDAAKSNKRVDGMTRLIELRNGELFDNVMFHKRLAISFDTLLIEADGRARERGKLAFIHVVGLGLGVWKMSPHQDKIFMETFASRIELLGERLSHVSDVRLSYINHDSCGKYKDGDVIPIEGHPTNGITVHISRCQPHEKLTGLHKGKLLVVSFAWDSNSLPGNEFWGGYLYQSSDSAAAASTQVSELHNPHINPYVCADNLKVVTKDGVVPLKMYQETIAQKKGIIVT